MKRRYEIHEKYTFILFYIYALRSHLWSHWTPFYHNSWNLLFLSVTFDLTKHQLRPPFKTGHIGQLVVLSIRRASVRPKLILGSTKPLLKLKDHPCFGHYHNLQWVITQHLYYLPSSHTPRMTIDILHTTICFNSMNLKKNPRHYPFPR